MDPNRVENSSIDIHYLICSICLLVCRDITQTPCEHNFCRICITEWLRSNNFCPYRCKTIRNISELKTSRTLKNIIEELKYYCIKGCGEAFRYNVLELHESECNRDILSNSQEPGFSGERFYSSGVIYENCEKDDKMFGEKLSSIVNYAIALFGVQDNTETTCSVKESFKRTCDALSSTVGGHEPKVINKVLKKTNEQELVSKMKSLVGRDVEPFNLRIEEAAQSLVTHLPIWDISNFGHFFYRECSPTNSSVREFKIIKVFRDGENLEIIPCYLEINVKKIRKRLLIIPWTKENELEFNYMEKKYILTKFTIFDLIVKTRLRKF